MSTSASSLANVCVFLDLIASFKSRTLQVSSISTSNSELPPSMAHNNFTAFGEWFGSSELYHHLPLLILERLVPFKCEGYSTFIIICSCPVRCLIRIAVRQANSALQERPPLSHCSNLGLKRSLSTDAREKEGLKRPYVQSRSSKHLLHIPVSWCCH